MKRTTLCIVLATIFGIDGQAAWAQSIPQDNPEAATTSGPPAAASDQPSTPSAVTLDHITVTGTRTPQKVKDVPGTVTVITSDVLEQEDAQNPTEAIRYEPGVSVGSDQVGRGTQTNFTIRGIGGNRVLLLGDGVEVPDFPGTNLDSGPYALFTRDTVDFDSLKQIEILRGPASALYGSDAIGGTVAYVTKDPSDYLNPINRSWYAAGKLSYDGADHSISETVTAAGRTDALEGLLVVTHRNGSETQVLDASPDPEKYHSENVLGKIVAHISSADSLTLTADALERRTSIDYATDIGFTDLGGGFGYQTIRSTGDDVTRRDRLSLDYVHEAPGAVVERSEVPTLQIGKCFRYRVVNQPE